MVYVGFGAFTGTGNASANSIVGGSGDDALDGGRGSDQLEGGLSPLGASTAGHGPTLRGPV